MCLIFRNNLQHNIPIITNNKIRVWDTMSGRFEYVCYGNYCFIITSVLS